MAEVAAGTLGKLAVTREAYLAFFVNPVAGNRTGCSAHGDGPSLFYCSEDSRVQHSGSYRNTSEQSLLPK